MLSAAFFIAILSLCIRTPVLARQVNMTIQDTDIDHVTYHNNWESHSLLNNKDSSISKVDSSMVSGGTWTTVIVPPRSQQNMTISWAGTAIYPQFVLPSKSVLPKNNTNPIYLHNYTFILDGTPQPDPFFHMPGPGYLYNQTVFSAEGLSNSNHTLTIIVSENTLPADDTHRNLAIFDSAIFTQEIDDDDPGPTSSRSHSHVGSIIGGVVGGTALVIIFTLVTVFTVRRRRRRRDSIFSINHQNRPPVIQNDSALLVHPYVMPSETTQQERPSERKPYPIRVPPNYDDLHESELRPKWTNARSELARLNLERRPRAERDHHRTGSLVGVAGSEEDSEAESFSTVVENLKEQIRALEVRMRRAGMDVSDTTMPPPQYHA